MSKNQGLVIAIDGPDGVGKSTQIKLLSDYLEKLGRPIYLARASGGTPIGDALRAVSLSDVPRSADVDLYISLAMGMAAAEEIKKHKATGAVCIADRSPLSAYAYQVHGSNLSDREYGIDATKRLLKAWDIDVLLIMNAPLNVMKDRREKRTDKPSDYFENKADDYHERTRQAYQQGIELAKEFTNVIEVNATPDIETIAQQIRQELESVL